LLMVFALAGDSTITKDFPILHTSRLKKGDKIVRKSAEVKLIRQPIIALSFLA